MLHTMLRLRTILKHLRGLRCAITQWWQLNGTREPRSLHPKFVFKERKVPQGLNFIYSLAVVEEELTPFT